MKICSDDIIFEIAHINNIHIICIFILIFSFFLFVLIKKKIISHFITTRYFVMTVILILCSVIILLLSVIASFSYHGCSCMIKKSESMHKEYKGDRVIIVGDSRMSLINDYYNEYNIPNNYEFIAESGAKIDWFVNGAIPSLENKLDKYSDDYRYHVVVNMGVNDLSHVDDAEKKALEYFSYYKNLALKYPFAKFYLLSVNPINKNIMEYRWSFMDINNSDIDKFNETLREKAKDIHPVLLYYCNSNRNIHFETYDGLHYKHDTSQEVVDYIKNKCVKV